MAKIKQQLPAYPLFVKDPFFSIWSQNEYLNEGDTVFWTGKRRKVYGIVRADGITYSFMGIVPSAEKLKQTSLKLTAFSTKYTFTCDKFDLAVNFTSPLLPDDLKTLSCPVCYMDYTITPKTKLGKVTVALYMHEESCYDRYEMPVRQGKWVREGYETAFFGLKKQLIMSQSFDDSAAEWGYWYVTGKTAGIATHNMLMRFVLEGALDFVFEEKQEKYIYAMDTVEELESAHSGTMTVAFDDLVSIYYFGEMRKGYYFDEGVTIFDALDDAIAHHDEVLKKCERFDAKLKKMAKPYGEDYLLVLYGGLRQAIAAHKLIKNTQGNPLFLSKECHSNGCLCTVDVSYPSIPLFLLFNPTLVEGMMRPIYKFAKMPVWEYDFAPHDIGTYPHACGQIYGLAGLKGAACPDFYDRGLNREYMHWGTPTFGLIPDTPYTAYPFYTLPKGSNMYEFEMQMPVEECGNMLIMQAATLLAGGEIALARDNYDLLSTWVKYLLKYGLMPGNQLCTDDFAGHLDKNINLSIKAIVGIEAFAIISEKLGYEDMAKEMHQKAKEYATEWKKMCVVEGKNTPLVFDGNPDETFSLKYNMAFDVMFGSHLFDEEVREREVDTYIAKANEYGVSLDSRSYVTKSDWILWTTVLTSNIEKRKALIAPVAKFLRETPQHYPFGDKYDSKDGVIVYGTNRYGLHRGFKNRSVQGGLFITLLADSGILKKQPSFH